MLASACNSCQCWRQLVTAANATKPTKPNLPNQTYQTKPTKPNLPNQTYQTKPTKPNPPKQLVEVVNPWVRSAFGNVFFNISIVFIMEYWQKMTQCNLYNINHLIRQSTPLYVFHGSFYNSVFFSMWHLKGNFRVFLPGLKSPLTWLAAYKVEVGIVNVEWRVNWKYRRSNTFLGCHNCKKKQSIR